MGQSHLLISKQKTVRSVKHLWLMLKKFISCLINNNEKDITKKVQLFYMPYQFWMFPCNHVFCTPKNQNLYGLMQTGTWWRFSWMQATNADYDNGKEHKVSHSTQNMWKRILVRRVARRNAVIISEKNFLVYNCHIWKCSTSESFLGSKFQYKQEQNMLYTRWGKIG